MNKHPSTAPLLICIHSFDEFIVNHLFLNYSRRGSDSVAERSKGLAGRHRQGPAGSNPTHVLEFALSSEAQHFFVIFTEGPSSAACHQQFFSTGGSFRSYDKTVYPANQKFLLAYYCKNAPAFLTNEADVAPKLWRNQETSHTSHGFRMVAIRNIKILDGINEFCFYTIVYTQSFQYSYFCQIRDNQDNLVPLKRPRTTRSLGDQYLIKKLLEILKLL
ncbi:unnamed protein product [Nesidiocoris tenuis]|uniref:Uncharacterized protein n=1 Tax=Nesidiocoris tenuis TaxID=355587 RepID=A0A6H5GGR1_9HEMI|nr:unnamed protein product [Nesidiocoris tenuis]